MEAVRGWVWIFSGIAHFGTTRSMQVATIPQIKFSNLNDYVMNKSTVQMQHF